MTDQPTDDEIVDEAVRRLQLEVIQRARHDADLITEMVAHTPATWVTTILHLRAAASSLRWQAQWEERHPVKDQP